MSRAALCRERAFLANQGRRKLQGGIHIIDGLLRKYHQHGMPCHPPRNGVELLPVLQTIARTTDMDNKTIAEIWNHFHRM